MYGSCTYLCVVSSQCRRASNIIRKNGMIMNVAVHLVCRMFVECRTRCDTDVVCCLLFMVRRFVTFYVHVTSYNTVGVDDFSLNVCVL